MLQATVLGLLRTGALPVGMRASIGLELDRAYAMLLASSENFTCLESFELAREHVLAALGPGTSSSVSPPCGF